MIKLSTAREIERDTVPASHTENLFSVQFLAAPSDNPAIPFVRKNKMPSCTLRSITMIPAAKYEKHPVFGLILEMMYTGTILSIVINTNISERKIGAD
jgi:hypothetical protein